MVAVMIAFTHFLSSSEVEHNNKSRSHIQPMRIVAIFPEQLPFWMQFISRGMREASLDSAFSLMESKIEAILGEEELAFHPNFFTFAFTNPLRGLLEVSRPPIENQRVLITNNFLNLRRILEPQILANLHKSFTALRVITSPLILPYALPSLCCCRNVRATNLLERWIRWADTVW